MCQGEWGLGQWEMNLDHGAPLAIADAHALFKLGVKTMGSRAGLSASFMARPETDTGIGSSCHVHVSLRDDDGRRSSTTPTIPTASAPRSVTASPGSSSGRRS